MFFARPATPERPNRRYLGGRAASVIATSLRRFPFCVGLFRGGRGPPRRRPARYGVSLGRRGRSFLGAWAAGGRSGRRRPGTSVTPRAGRRAPACLGAGGSVVTAMRGRGRWQHGLERGGLLLCRGHGSIVARLGTQRYGWKYYRTLYRSGKFLSS